MAKIFNIWFSPLYHTRELCRVLGESVQKYLPASVLHEHDLTDFDATGNGLEIGGEDMAILGAPVYAGRIPTLFAEKVSSMRGNGAKAILLVSYGNRAFDDALVELANLAGQAGFRPIGACACIARHTIAQTYAQGRPDGRDLTEVAEFGRKMAELPAEPNTGAALSVPGNLPDKPGPRFPLPQTVNENCVRCGICQAKCPARAIDFKDPALVDQNKCICCMRCVGVCPENARIPNAEFIAAITKKLEPVCKTAKSNEFFA